MSDQPATSEPQRAPAGSRGDWVPGALASIGHLLPAQGPMSVFVHHNTLHAFQHLPFEEAVLRAHETLGGEPYLTLADYRAAYARGRITAGDLDTVLERHLPQDAPLLGGSFTRRSLQRLAMIHGLEAETAGGLSFLTHECGLLTRFPADLPDAARARLAAGGPPADVLATAWNKALEITPRATLEVAAPFVVGRDGSHEEGLSLVGSPWPVSLGAHTLAIRLAAGFLDLGMATWPMPRRSSGLWVAFLGMFSGRTLAKPDWQGLGAALLPLAAEGAGANTAIEAALEALCVEPEHREAYLRQTVLGLRGWCGMFQRLETHPHEAPSGVPVRLADFVAVLLWLEVSAVQAAARAHLGPEATIAALATLYAKAERQRLPRGPEATAYRVWRTLVYAGIDARALESLNAADGARLLTELVAFDSMTQRRLWHAAYERHHRELYLDALAAQRRARPPASSAPAPYQVVFCIDEREESFRRHLEELEPTCATFGTAGFFGLAIEYSDADELHAVPLCPVGQRPTHKVAEVPLQPDRHLVRQRKRRTLAELVHGVRVASRGLLAGVAASVTTGLAAGVAMAVRVFSPRMAGQLRAAAEALLERSPTRLVALRPLDGGVAGGEGFTPGEAAQRVASLLQNVGLVRDFAPLVVFVGHGSTSLNNPHESAHDCGACGGRRGAPNARLVAALANDPAVRTELACLGIAIPDGTWFVGGYHDTSSDAVTLFDDEETPAGLTAAHCSLRRRLDEARARNAHERSRRFAWAPRPATPGHALRHVEARADAIGEPRPEYGHCTNAMAVVGRRDLTRGLFLDRRAFLVSYDARQDPAGAVLERILSAVGPVGAGISLEYYFSFVDNRRWGCGTKLPHNVTSLLGVMDGHLSDLRTGLPLQMVELHEPVRLLMVVEATPARLLEIAARQPVVRELVVNGWVQLVSVDPHDGRMQVFDGGAFQPYEPRPVPLPRAGGSAAWYGDRDEHLGPALVFPEEQREAVG